MNITTDESNNTLTIVSQLQLKKHILPAARYQEVAKYFEAVLKDENQKIVLKRE